MTRTFLLLSTAASLLLTYPAFAQETKKEAAKKETVKAEAVKAEAVPEEKDTPLTEWRDAENALIDPLSDKNKESFFILRNKYAVIRVIRVVERDIKNAVESCGKNNPDIKDAMNTRFKQWQGAVVPILDTAKKQLDKDIESQKIVDVKDAKKVLKLNDEAYEYGEKQIVKKPVTTKEACGDLVKSMDRTEDDMITLLQQTLLPEGVIRQRGEAADKAKAKEEAKEKIEKAKPSKADKEEPKAESKPKAE